MQSARAIGRVLDSQRALCLDAMGDRVRLVQALSQVAQNRSDDLHIRAVVASHRHICLDNERERDMLLNALLNCPRREGKRRSNANIPSVKTIQDRLIDYHAQWLEMPRKRAALIVREAMEVAEGRVSLDDARTLVPWLRNYVGASAVAGRVLGGWGSVDADSALMIIDVLLDGHGVEELPTVDGTDTIAYVNMGDPYVPTVLYDYEKNRFYVTDWGTIVEGDEDRFRERSDQPGEEW